LAGADEKLHDEVVSGLFAFLLISEAGVPQRCEDVGHEVEVLHRSHTGSAAGVRDTGQQGGKLAAEQGVEALVVELTAFEDQEPESETFHAGRYAAHAADFAFSVCVSQSGPFRALPTASCRMKHPANFVDGLFCEMPSANLPWRSARRGWGGQFGEQPPQVGRPLLRRKKKMVVNRSAVP
jgi:hypothetical protein